jgi:hypothetical protein
MRIYLGSLTFIMFILIKVAGTSLADWSWWWILFPVVPDLAFIFMKLGWTL